MAFPTISPLAQRVYGQASRLQRAGDDEARGWPLAKLCGSLFDGVSWVYEAFMPDGDDPAGGRLLDPDATPGVLVRWLGQFAGVQTTRGAADVVQRDEVRTAAGRKRGRPASLIADVQRTLTGTRFVAYVPFVSGDRWRIAVRTLPGETPDAAATFAAALGQKVYGIVLDHVATVSPLWDESGTAVSWDVAGSVSTTWDDVTNTDVGA